MTLNDIDVLLHYYIRPGDHPRIDAPAVQEAIQKFITQGIFYKWVWDLTEREKIKVTEKGKAWLQMILDTPYPESKTMWVDPRTEDIIKI